MIDLSSIFTHCNSINAEVSIYRTTYAYTDDGERWLCSFTLKNEGSELKVQGRGATGDEAIRSAHEKHGAAFLDKVFTPAEQALCLAKADPYPSLAARFAAKLGVSVTREGQKPGEITHSLGTALIVSTVFWLSAAIVHAFNVPTVSFHLGRDVSTIDITRELSPEQLAQAAAEVGQGVGLGEEGHPGLADAAAHHHVVGVAAGEEHRRAGEAGGQRLGHLAAVGAGHHDVREQQMQRKQQSAEQRQDRRAQQLILSNAISEEAFDALQSELNEAVSFSPRTQCGTITSCSHTESAPAIFIMSQVIFTALLAPSEPLRRAPAFLQRSRKSK